MPALKGQDLLLKMSDGQVPEGFVTLAGLRSREIVMNARPVDATSADSPEGWRELLGGSGLRTARIEGRGIVRDAASDARIRTVFFAGHPVRWQIVVPGQGRLTGPMQITALSWSGQHDGVASFAITLESAGPLAFETA
jgi:TP901-1 family phage major tail protein